MVHPYVRHIPVPVHISNRNTGKELPCLGRRHHHRSTASQGERRRAENAAAAAHPPGMPLPCRQVLGRNIDRRDSPDMLKFPVHGVPGHASRHVQIPVRRKGPSCHICLRTLRLNGKEISRQRILRRIKDKKLRRIPVHGEFLEDNGKRERHGIAFRIRSHPHRLPEACGQPAFHLVTAAEDAGDKKYGDGDMDKSPGGIVQEIRNAPGPEHHGHLARTAQLRHCPDTERCHETGKHHSENPRIRH